MFGKKQQAPTEAIPARNVRPGQIYVCSPSGGPTRRRGSTVIRTNYLQEGEGGKPTVYIETADKPGWTYCLDPDELVTVAA